MANIYHALGLKVVSFISERGYFSVTFKIIKVPHITSWVGLLRKEVPSQTAAQTAGQGSACRGHAFQFHVLNPGAHLPGSPVVLFLNSAHNGYNGDSGEGHVPAS